MQNQNAQIAKLVEFLKQNPGYNVVFKKFVNDFFKFNFNAQLEHAEHVATHENDYDELNVLAGNLMDTWQSVYGSQVDNICNHGLTFIVNRGYPKEFCEWFGDYITQHHLNNDFVSQLHLDVLKPYYDKETYQLETNDDTVLRFNKIFEFIDSKIGYIEL